MCVYYKNIILPILLLTLKEKYLKESHYFSDSMLKGVLLRSYKRRGHRSSVSGELKTVVTLLGVLAPWPKDVSSARLLRQP